MKTWWISTLLLVLASVQVFGQIRIKGYEYWYDSDYNNRIQQNFSPQATFSLDLMADMSKLNEGLHRISIRFRDTDNNWSSIYSRMVYKTPEMQYSQLIGFEYWFNDEHDKKVSEPISNSASFNHQALINTDHLPDGMHLFQVRYRDYYNNWSPVQWRFFLKQTKPTSTVLIVAYRYWVDEDPVAIYDVPLTTPLSIVDINRDVQIEGVEAGTHYFHIQFKDSEGNWSSVHSAKFEMVNCHPQKCEKPTGVEVMCQGDDKASILTNGAVGADTYEWFIEPENAGVLFPNEKQMTINWNPDFSGEALVYARGVNTCGPGEKSDPLSITIVPKLDKPDVPTGNNKLCVKPSDGIYKINELKYATSYEWKLEPEKAGVVLAQPETDPKEAEISWKEDFTGVVKLYVRGVNETCKKNTENPFSDPLEISINPFPEAPEITATGVLDFCIGGQVTLEGPELEEYEYLWSNQSQTKSILVKETGAYTLIVIDPNGCPSLPSEALSVKAYTEPDKPEIEQNEKTLYSNYSDGNQWFKGKTAIQGEVYRAFLPSELGEYSVQYTDEQGCSSKSEPFTYMGLGVAELKSGKLIKVYPNPNNGEFSVRIPNGVRKQPTFSVFDITGKRVQATFEYLQEEFKVDVKGKSKGQYLLKIQFDDETLSIPFSIF